MTWWILTFLYNSRAWTTLYTLAWTNRDAHLFMAWANYKPARRKVYKNVRGVSVHCGYRWIWDTPNITEQSESGDTYTHTFKLEGLRPTDHVWYYLFSPAPDLSRQCQGPLIHILPPEVPMASARIFNSIAQPIPTDVNTPISFNSAAWDDGGFYNAGSPTRLTIPVDGLYSLGCCFRLVTTLNSACRAQLRRGGSKIIAQHTHHLHNAIWDAYTLSLHTIQRFRAGHYIEVMVYHTVGIARNIAAGPDYSPHFWITYLGPYPA